MSSAMFSILFVFTLNAVLAIDFAPSPAPVTPEVSKLEAAVLAKFGGEASLDAVKPEAQQDSLSSWLSSAPTPEESAPATTDVQSQTSVSPEVSKLEAAVLAKYSTETQVDASKAEATSNALPEVAKLEADSQQQSLASWLSSAPLTEESAPVTADVRSQTRVSPDVSKLEAAVLTKYSTETPADASKAEATSNVSPEVAQLEAAKLEVKKLEEAKLEAAKLEVARLEAAVLAKASADAKALPVDYFAPKAETTSDASSEVANLEAAVLAKVGTGLNVRKVEESESKTQSQSLDSWLSSPPGLEDSMPASDASVATGKAADEVKPKEQGSSLETWLSSAPGLEDSKPANEPLNESKKGSSVNMLKRTDVSDQTSQSLESWLSAPPVLEESAGSEMQDKATVESAKPEVGFTGLPLKPIQEEVPEAAPASAQKAKKVVMQSEHYRNHGGAMHHVEPTAPSTAPRTAAQEAAAKRVEKRAAEHAAKLAEKHAEIDDAFHLSKASGATTLAGEAEAPVGVWRKVMRFLFLFAALICIAGFAMHKFEVICKIASGEQGPIKKFKAKQEDLPTFAASPALQPTFAAPPRFAKQTSEAVGGSSGGWGLKSRRGMSAQSQCDTRVCDFA